MTVTKPPIMAPKPTISPPSTINPTPAATTAEAILNIVTTLVFNDAWSGLEVAWTETVDFLADAWSMFTNRKGQH